MIFQAFSFEKVGQLSRDSTPKGLSRVLSGDQPNEMNQLPITIMKLNQYFENASIRCKHRIGTLLGCLALLFPTSSLFSQDVPVCNLVIDNQRSDNIVVFSVNKETGEEFPIDRVYPDQTNEGLVAQGGGLRFKEGCSITENGMKIEGGTVIHQVVTPNTEKGTVSLTVEMKGETVTPFPGQ